MTSPEDYIKGVEEMFRRITLLDKNGEYAKSASYAGLALLAIKIGELKSAVAEAKEWDKLEDMVKKL